MLYKIKEKILTVIDHIKLITFHRPSKSNHNIGFICGFHGKSGGPIAISNIANMLSLHYAVQFKVPITSYYNRLLLPRVKLKYRFNENLDILFFDLSASYDEVRKLKGNSIHTILTIHGLKTSLHRLKSCHIEKMLTVADEVHFVGNVQQESYNLPEDSYFVIPNSTTQVIKTKSTNNIGTVGNLNEKRKGAEQTIELGLHSAADEIHLWSTSKIYSSNTRVIHHSWEQDKSRIFNSFDVLVFLSNMETFGLVVAEAVSAGLPCVLSNIPAFEPFRNIPGVILLDKAEFNLAPQIINQLLLDKEKLRGAIIAQYDEKFSEEVICKKWIEKIESLRE